MKQPCVYILASRMHGTLYVGSTSNLEQRLMQHVSGEVEGFTKRHKVTRLVYAEFHETMNAALQRERQIKSWRRSWKIQLIEEANSEWRDISADMLQ